MTSIETPHRQWRKGPPRVRKIDAPGPLTIHDATAEEAIDLLPHLRLEDLRELATVALVRGLTPEDALRDGVKRSRVMVAAHSSAGKPVAVFGVADDEGAGGCGAPWGLATLDFFSYSPAVLNGVWRGLETRAAEHYGEVLGLALMSDRSFLRWLRRSDYALGSILRSSTGSHYRAYHKQLRAPAPAAMVN